MATCPDNISNSLPNSSNLSSTSKLFSNYEQLSKIPTIELYIKFKEVYPMVFNDQFLSFTIKDLLESCKNQVLYSPIINFIKGNNQINTIIKIMAYYEQIINIFNNDNEIDDKDLIKYIKPVKSGDTFENYAISVCRIMVLYNDFKDIQEKIDKIEQIFSLEEYITIFKYKLYQNYENIMKKYEGIYLRNMTVFEILEIIKMIMIV